MLERTLLTSKNKEISIKSESEALETHFSNLNNYADVVLNQINHDRFYDRLFAEKNDLTVIDFGANIGLFSLYVHDSAKIVYSVEPTPEHFNNLKETTKDYPNIYPINIALSDKNQIIDFYVCRNNTTMNSLANRYGESFQIKGMTLDSLLIELGLSHVDFVKCDIEGSEMIALTKETIEPVKDKIDFWFLEVHATDVSIQKNREDLSNIFRDLGYKVEASRIDVLLAYKEQ